MKKIIKKLKKIKPFKKKPRDKTNEVWKKIKPKLLELKIAQQIYEEECRNAQENY
jgi:hypothetical protein